MLSNDHHFREDNAKLGIFILYESDIVVLLEHHLTGAHLKNQFEIARNQVTMTGINEQQFTFTYPWPDHEIWSVCLQGKDKLLITLKQNYARNATHE